MVLIKVRQAPVPVLLLVSLARLLLFMGSLKQASKLVWPTVLTKVGQAPASSLPRDFPSNRLLLLVALRQASALV